MSVFAKLQEARIILQNTPMKKSGLNKFAGYSYFELGDFLPQVNKIFAELKLFSATSFTADLATLHVIDTEDNSQVTFTSPMAEANLKGCHPIQNLGAVQTYQRRYLYVAAMEIVEHDAVDRVTGGEKPSPKPVLPAAIPANAGAGEDLDEDQRNRLTDAAIEIKDAWEVDDYDKMFDLYNKHKGEVAETNYLWYLLSSEIRTKIKQMGKAAA